MRRAVFVLVLVVPNMFLFATPAFAPCVEMRFDTLVRQAGVIWWGTVTGTTRLPSSGNLPGDGSALTVRILDVLKGPGRVGQSRPVVLGSCGPVSRLTNRSYLEQYVGQTQLFIGGYERDSDALVTTGVILKPENLSPTQQYRRAAKDLGLQGGPPVGFAPPEAGGSTGLESWWVVVGPVIVLAIGVLIIIRRRSRGDSAKTHE